MEEFMQEIDLSTNWLVLQDVKNCGEKFCIYKSDWNPTKSFAHVISEWEPIDRLTHLQLLFSRNPYYGGELRRFNDAPWWYKN